MSHDRFRLLCLFLALLFSGGARADTLTHEANIENFDDDFYEWHFTTSAEVVRFDSITVELSHENIEQVQVFMENTGGGSPYAFFTLVNGFGDGDGNMVGVPDGDLTDLDGLAELTFVPSGPSNTVLETPINPVPSGMYLADDWENNFGTGSPPYEPTTWRLAIRDSSIAFDKQGAVGRLSVNFTTTGVDGDFDDNGLYECADIDGLVAAIANQSNDLDFDLSGDGVVDQADRDKWLQEAGPEMGLNGAVLMGDANLDGVVDVTDLNRWNANKFSTLPEWCGGDFNADGFIDVTDLNLWNANKFQASTMAVPEPATGVLLATLVVVLCFRLRNQLKNQLENRIVKPS